MSGSQDYSVLTKGWNCHSSAHAPSSGLQTLFPSLPLPLGTSSCKFLSLGLPSPLRLLFKNPSASPWTQRPRRYQTSHPQARRRAREGAVAHLQGRKGSCMDKSSEDLGSGPDLTLDRPCLWPGPQLSFRYKDVKLQRFVVRAVGGRGPWRPMEMLMRENPRPPAPSEALGSGLALGQEWAWECLGLWLGHGSHQLPSSQPRLLLH